MAWHMSRQSYAQERVERGNYPATSVQYMVQRNINESIFSLWLFANYLKYNTFLQVTR